MQAVGDERRRQPLHQPGIAFGPGEDGITLVACTGGEAEPKDYGEVNTKGEGYYGNFMYGCTGVEPKDGKYVDVKLESADFCRCVYDGLKEKVPFSDMQEFEKEQADAADGEIVIPKNIATVQDECADESRS